MDLYRVFPWDNAAEESAPGGVFYAARNKQGAGRHDIPHLDGVIYCSQTAQSALAEWIQFYRGRTISSIHLQRPDQLVIALAHIQCESKAVLLDLDDPKVLVRLNIRPSQVMTHDRTTTQKIAERLYTAGTSGLLWPSTLESSWINATLFAARSRPYLRLVTKIIPVQLDMPALLEAASSLNVGIHA